MTEEVTRSLLQLGDPSGRQDQQYWDDWFQAVCCRDDSHRPFEWYTSPDEVVRVISYHLTDGEVEEAEVDATDGGGTTSMSRRMIHPGSGTSLLPLVLWKHFPSYRQVVVEISPVAIQEMKEVHEAEFLHRVHENFGQRCPIDYTLADLMDPKSLALDASSFNAWIDKGFLDAVFDAKQHEKNHEQAKNLFREAHRLLGKGGLALVVTLGEQHSLRLILENWMAIDTNGGRLWSTDLHIWEMQPVSGEMVPFGIVFNKSTARESKSDSLSLFHHAENDERQSNLPKDADKVYDTIHDHLLRARDAFAQRKRSEGERFVLLTLDVKPYDAETDLASLGRMIRRTNWKTVGPKGELELSPKWQAFEGPDHVMERVIPIGFGISKLRLKCILPSEQVDPLVSAIEEWEGDKVMMGVQSVDVDWDETVAIADMSSLIRDRK